MSIMRFSTFCPWRVIFRKPCHKATAGAALEWVNNARMGINITINNACSYTYERVNKIATYIIRITNVFDTYQTDSSSRGKAD